MKRKCSYNKMVIYTPITLNTADKHLQKFDVGTAEALTPLEGGTTNSNFHVRTTKGQYVLTVMEPDEEAAQIPWLAAYLDYLSQNNIPVPHLIKTKQGNITTKIRGKDAILTPFFQGKDAAATPSTAFKAGELLGKMNKLSENYPHSHPQPWGITELRKKRTQVAEQNLSTAQKESLAAFDRAFTWDGTNVSQGDISYLPKGVVHSDFFPDNILFKDDTISAVIDFYKAGCDVLAFDFAMGLLAWGFDDDGHFLKDVYQNFYKGYTSVRPLTPNEKTAMPHLFTRACATIILMRILRAQILKEQPLQSSKHDAHSAEAQEPEGVRPPTAYLERLNFIQKNKFQSLLHD